MMKDKRKKVPLWLPYTSEITVKKTVIHFAYKGGTCDIDIKDTLSILLYGNTCPLPHDFLDVCVKYGVPICIHRRNMPKAVWITPSTTTTTQEDILSRQISVRNNEKKSRHITRKLLDAKFKGMEWLVPYPFDFKKATLPQQTMVAIEARHARVYWERYYALLGYTGTRRGKANELKSILDAVSKLVSGVLLRYIVYHRMSPYHGFTHTPNDYPSLVYDLMEPYRGYVDKAVFNAVLEARNAGVSDPKELMARCITAVEDMFDEDVYVPATRQLASFQELLHGSVLALRAYIQGISRQLIVPMPGKPNGGRPLNVGYRLYGRSAGPTDFWARAEKTSARYAEKLSLSLH